MSAIGRATRKRLPKLIGSQNRQKGRKSRSKESLARDSGTSTDPLNDVYADPRAPGSFGGVHSLKRYVGRSEREVKKFLSGRDAYTLHKPRRIRFPRRRTYSKGIADLYQIDLADVSNLSSFNDGMRYLLTCIDVFTKRAWAVPVRTKSGSDVAKAFEKIVDERKCTMVQSDKGTEFLNATFQSMLSRHGIHFYTSENEDLKASIVERFNRTLKTKMYRYFTHANTRRYVDVLGDLLHSYNHTYHRSIGMAPAEVGQHNEQEVRARLYPTKPKSYKWKHDVGDKVRITMQRQPFRKGYLGEWSEEIFEIASRLPTVPVTYELRDLAGELIKGKFYEFEVQKVIKSDVEHFDIDRILKTRKRGGKIEYLVSWKGYPSKFNSWVDEIVSKSSSL